ncbi:MAG: guanylate kinase [Lachnospiraceae bacterium]|nr:guanylate kinase [Lachnospiraceae bacterium]
MLYVLMGKSASGKDTIFKRLLDIPRLNIKKIVPYTTRPLRLGETDGDDYHFVNSDTMHELEVAGKIIEHRCYHTVHGDWHYFTADDGLNIKGSNERFLTIGTLEAYIKLREYYGAENVTPIYIYVDDFERINRSLKREKKQDAPSVSEVCRRFLADENDFSEELLEKSGIDVLYENIDIDTCVKAISDMILI